MPARTVRQPRRVALAVEQLEARDVPSVSVSVAVPGGHHHRHHHGGVSVQVHVGPGVLVNVSVPFVGVHVSV